MRQLFLTSAQFGYIHLYACALHGLPAPTVENCDQEGAPEMRTERWSAPQIRDGFFERLAERLILAFLKQ